MHDRFYKRYHPIKTYRGRVPNLAQKKGIDYSYLIDIQSMLHPALSSGRLLQRIIFSFGNATREGKKQHFGLLKGFIWNT
jgi:hypothetical protein